MIHEEEVTDLDSVSVLLCAIRVAATRFDMPYFNRIGDRTKYRDVIPCISAIPKEWWHDMRIAGSEPMWIAEESVIFRRADGQTTEGVIAIGCPHAGAMPVYQPWCFGWLKCLNGADDWRWVEYTSGSAFQALQLAMSSMAARLREFVLGGGRVLTSDGTAEIDLGAIFGPLWSARGQAEGLQEGLARGQAEGVTRGKAEALLAVLAARGIAVGDADRARILGESDPTRLERWLAGAVTCTEAAELFTMRGGR